MGQVSRLSEIMYVHLCNRIGTPTVVTIRRHVRDMEDMIEQNIHTGKHACTGRCMLSGSRREGFRFNSSDCDYMVWFCPVKVIEDISQLREHRNSVILVDGTDTPPGFVRLQLLTVPENEILESSIVTFNDRIYISSLCWRQIFHKEFSRCGNYQNVVQHGPCSSGNLDSDSGGTAVDRAVCFTCKYWPSITRPWMERCQRHNWPPTSVLKDIVENNYHCVAIGSKITTSENELEWRLSFSLAEQKLVYTMNHTQFICYGLLKIFRSEVINHNMEEPLLCSYFMKTTLFWLIQIGHANWSPNNLLECFWVCFKYLILCVHRGKFPNFFIPQNNMFINKVAGVARDSLLEQLHQYYRMGVACILLSPTLRSILESAINPVRNSEDRHIHNNLCMDALVKGEIKHLSDIKSIKRNCLFHLRSVDTLIHSSMSQYNSLTLQYYTAEFLVHSAFTIANRTSYFKQKYVYYLDRMLCNMLKLSSRIGTISHPLYLAIYYYRTGRYKKALYVTNLTKQRLSKPYIMYHGIFDRHRYQEDISGMSLSRRMKIAWAVDIKFYRKISYLEELTSEQLIDSSGSSSLYFPVLVIVEMMSVLSNYRLGNISQYQLSLTDLYILLLSVEDRYIPLEARDISWYILGISQQIVGDLHGALDSFQESLREQNSPEMQKTTKTKIAFIQHQLNR